MSDFRNNIRKNGILAVASGNIKPTVDFSQFEILLKKTPARDQKQTGRCWIEAGLDWLSYTADIDGVALSSSFTAYYDLLWKIDCCLQFFAATRSLPTEDYLLHLRLKQPLTDAGQWQAFEHIVKQHGVIPENEMPHSVVNDDTRVMIAGLNQLLRRFAHEIRENTAFSLSAMQEQAKSIIEGCIGSPPDSFMYQGKTFTPLSFYHRFFSRPLSEACVSLVNIPDVRPYNSEYRIKWLYSPDESNTPIAHYNMPTNYIKEGIAAQLRAGIPVWIGVDADHFADKNSGIFDVSLFQFESVFNTRLLMEKGDALLYRDSMMTHAMLIWGMHQSADGTQSYCVKNSFGNTAGKDGYCYMSGEWFDRFVYQAVIQNRFLPDRGARLRGASVVLCEPWDPLGCLAD